MSTHPGTLILVRHGQSQWNLENRFTGWVDVELSPTGIEEAQHAGQILKSYGLHFDYGFTSALRRAQETLRIILEVTGQTDLQIERDQALNERHYGDLQGLNKAETAKKFGDEQVHIWRRSYDVPPPNGESLKMTSERTLPYYHAKIAPRVLAGQTIIVAAHGNSLRSLVKELDQLSNAEILELNIPTGVPLRYVLSSTGQVLERGYLDQVKQG
jgi:2,3-bisphosphoglycerate-dependent phosphoglycerate mutase